MAEASGSRTHLRHKVPHAGFEDQTQHRPRLASTKILASNLKLVGRASRGSGQTEVDGALLHRLDAELDVLI